MPEHGSQPAGRFLCTVCEEDKPVCQTVRIPRGTSEPHVEVCRDCYDDGVADGIIDPATGDFAE